MVTGTACKLPFQQIPSVPFKSQCSHKQDKVPEYWCRRVHLEATQVLATASSAEIGVFPISPSAEMDPAEGRL